MDATTGENLPAFWHAIGILGASVFYTRFYVQWVYSEYRGRSEVPVVFWYLSGLGSLSLLAYGVVIGSPIGTLSHCFNTVIYARNLIHIWAHGGKLSRLRYVMTHALVFAISGTAIVLTVLTWRQELGATQAVADHSPDANTLATYLWLAVGVVGQGLFATRFLVQWAATERKKESIIPPAFWGISLLAALLLAASHLARAEYVYAGGLGATLIVYLRNLMLIRRERNEIAS